MIHKRKVFKIFLMTVLSISMMALLADILGYSAGYEHYSRFIIFIVAATFSVYLFSKNQFDQSLTFVIISVLFNPLYAIHIQHHVWKFIEFPVLFLYTRKLYTTLYAEEIQMIENTAYLLDRYLKELDRTISTLSYPQISIYIKNRYPEQCKIDKECICWHIDGLPDIEFEVLYFFYSLSKNRKGGINVKFLNKFANMEAHVNLNLTSGVKYTIKDGIGKNSPTHYAKQIKQILVMKYHYLEL